MFLSYLLYLNINRNVIRKKILNFVIYSKSTTAYYKYKIVRVKIVEFYYYILTSHIEHHLCKLKERFIMSM